MSEKQYKVYSAMSWDDEDEIATLTFTDGKLTGSELPPDEADAPDPFWLNVKNKSSVDEVAKSHNSFRLVPVEGSTS